MNNGEFRPGEFPDYRDANIAANSGAKADVPLAIAWVSLARTRGFATNVRHVTVLRPFVF
jgi:hypothetical protein